MHFSLFSDGGNTFSNQIYAHMINVILKIFWNRFSYIGKGQIIVAARWWSFIFDDFGKIITESDSILYYKIIGYGSPEKEGRINIKFIYGKINTDAIEGTYR